MNTTPDAVHAGLAEWDKTKKLAQEALERCKKAEEQTSYYRGQWEAIKTQCDNLTARNTALTEENAEIKMLLSDLGRRFLDVLEGSKLAPFRPAGRAATRSPENVARNHTDGGNRTDRAAIPERTTIPLPNFENQLKEIARQVSDSLPKG